MNIKILDSWLREFLKTEAKPEEIAEKLSLTAVSIERLEKVGSDTIFDIEVTTNRPDLMSVTGLAREASVVLPEFGIKAEFKPQLFKKIDSNQKLAIEILNDSELVNRICAVALEVNLGASPKVISDRLEASDIRVINSTVDITNYVMREIGHPMHAFDYDKLVKFGRFIVRESKPGEKIRTLDGQEHKLLGGDIVAEDGKGTIIDLLGVMGCENSAIDENTKRILLFVDNNNQNKIRKTSMNLGIRSEAAILNEKGVDPEKALDAILKGAELLEKNAGARIISSLFDEYPNKAEKRTISVYAEKINNVIGIEIPLKTCERILSNLGFGVSTENGRISAQVPTWRANDVSIAEDLIEEVARIFGYFKLPAVLPGITGIEPYTKAKDNFYWEMRAREAFKYWGFTEVYTYPMVSEALFEGPISEAVTIKNPLTEDHIYMRRTIVPSLLEAVRENKNREELKLFEISNVYLKNKDDLPEERLKLAAVLKAPKVAFFDAKGIIEGLLADLGIKNYEFKPSESGAVGASVYVQESYTGEVEVLEDDLIDFELDFEVILKHVSLKKTYNPISKYPESTEDLRFEIDETIPYEKIVNKIKEQSDLVKKVKLLDVYQNKKTFRILYQSRNRNLTSEDLTNLREKIISSLKKNFKAVHV